VTAAAAIAANVMTAAVVADGIFIGRSWKWLGQKRAFPD
jgi:hypothetical protein